MQVGRQNHQLGDAETAIGQYQNALQLLSEAIDFREKAKMARDGWIYMDLYGFIWIYMDLYGFRWI